jgi:hypothetical protein
MWQAMSQELIRGTSHHSFVDHLRTGQALNGCRNIHL